MSIFGRNFSTNVDVPVYESGYGVGVNGDLIAIQEGYEDQLAIIEAIHTLDMEEIELRKDIRALEESGVSYSEIESRMAEYDSVMEAATKTVWQRIKEFFANMLGKLKQFFASVIRFFDGLFKSGKEFATNYEKELKALKLEGYEFKMFRYTNLESNKAPNFLSLAEETLSKRFDLDGKGKKAAELQKEIDKIDDDKEDAMNALRGTFVGGGNLDKDEFSKELYSYFRNGAESEEDKEELKVNINEVISTLKDSKALKVAQDAESDCKKVFDKKIQEITGMEKEHKKLSDSYYKSDSKASQEEKDTASKLITLAQRNSSLFSEAKTIALEYFRAWKDAITERNSTYKAICVNAFKYKKKDR